ncbi:response regulator [Ramlibacter sp. AN1015]|uniref:response regulator n=1 Tax=Ramlibacter sp. AN1015 TaxID=3133428 RepID=UPI0030BFA74E
MRVGAKLVSAPSRVMDVRPEANEARMPSPVAWFDIGRAMFDGSSDCVVLLDCRGFVVRVNDNGLALLGADAHEAVAGRHWTSCWPVHCEAAFRAAIAAALEGRTSGLQAPCPTASGTPKWWDVRTAPLPRDGAAVSHILCVARDITTLMDAQAATQLARSLAEAAAQSARNAMRARTEFVANVSHELRTPLSAIGGLAHLLLDLDPTAQQRSYLQQIELAGQHAAMLMEEMLDLTEAEAGNLRLHERELDFVALLTETTSLVRQIAVSKGLELRACIDPDVPVEVLADATRLRNIFLSCASRAVALVGSSTLEVRVKVLERSADAVRVHGVVRRAGSCLSPQEIELLVGPPAQPDAPLPGARGLGLGLTISRANAHLMQGDLGVSTDAAEGVSFWFTARLRLRPAIGAPESSSHLPSPALQGKRVLIVEDDALAREVTQHLLERAGMEVCVACDGAQGVAAVQAQRFDAVLMDIQMPVMNGMEATRAIREQLGLRALPVIAVTGNVLEKDRRDCIEAGMSDFLSKPVDAPRLWSSLARLIALADPRAHSGMPPR